MTDTSEKPPLLPSESTLDTVTENNTISIIQPKWKRVTSVVLLSLLALLNVADKFCISGIIPQIQQFYNKSDSEGGGILSLTYILATVVFSLVAAVFGDRFNRKWLIVGANMIGATFMFISTIKIKPELWAVFVFLRALVSIGLAFSYGICSSMIGDYFKGNARGYALMIFYWSMPIGYSVGISVATFIVDQDLDWRYALYVWPIAETVLIALIAGLVTEPIRGCMEDGSEGLPPPTTIKGIFSDFKKIITIKSYVCIVIAVAANDFVLNASGVWTPSLINEALNISQDTFHHISFNGVNTIIGVELTIGGIVGGVVSVSLAQAIKDGKSIFAPMKTMRAFPIIGAIGTLVATPAFLLAQPALKWDVFISLAFSFILGLFPAGNNVLAMDVIMEVIVPSRRASAASILYVIANILGDCPGPYIAGLISDSWNDDPENHEARFDALTVALYVTGSVFLICFIAFIGAAIFMKSDKERLDNETKKKNIDIKSAAESKGKENSIKSPLSVSDSKGKENSIKSPLTSP